MECAGAEAPTPGAQSVAEVYVDPLGADSNPGTASAPVKTLPQAQYLARVLISQGKTGVTVILGDGTYPLTEALTFDYTDSGTRNNPTVYKAAESASPIISGGVAVTGWTQEKAGRWTAPVKGLRFRQFYVNGARAKRARGPFPEGAERFGELKAIDADAGFLVPEKSLPPLHNPADLELGFYNSWSHMIARVRDITLEPDGRKRITMQQPGCFLVCRKEGVKAELPAYMENALELLDEPGEWYHDVEEGCIYYLPRNGEDMATATCVAPVLETLVSVRGTLNEPVRDLRFEGITFADATWMGPSDRGHADVQANCVIEPTNLFERDGSLVNLHNEYVMSPANVQVGYTRRIFFSKCTFTRLGGAGLDLGLGAQECEVKACTFTDISGSGIQIGCVSRDGHHPADEGMVVCWNMVANCRIHGVGVEYEDSIGIFAGYASCTLIERNEIYNLPYSGISVGWGWGEEDSGGGNYPIPFVYEKPTPSRDNRIANNHIYHVMLKRQDGGGIYTLGNQPGTVIEGNYIHDNEGWPGGIYLDEGSGFIEIRRNAVHGAHTPMNYNNRAQDRINTCNEHDNWFGIAPEDPAFPKEVAANAGPQDKE
ncbi:MAG: right-handed parallel beta-helix repeat-containing protein [Candidatus Hydrogenedentes bacterium]|nr:right-handed parallel beta-helix repeat-containing protein [Candidatus Hydrogenedentota bacterium]